MENTHKKKGDFVSLFCFMVNKNKKTPLVDIYIYEYKNMS